MNYHPTSSSLSYPPYKCLTPNPCNAEENAHSKRPAVGLKASLHSNRKHPNHLCWMKPSYTCLDLHLDWPSRLYTPSYHVRHLMTVKQQLTTNLIDWPCGHVSAKPFTNWSSNTQLTKPVPSPLRCSMQQKNEVTEEHSRVLSLSFKDDSCAVMSPY